MRLLMMCAAIALPASSVAAPPGASAKARESACRSANLHLADTPPKAEVKRLEELPAGNLMLAVVREVDGCNEPVVVRYGFGAGAESRRAPQADAPKRPRARIYR